LAQVCPLAAVAPVRPDCVSLHVQTRSAITRIRNVVDMHSDLLASVPDATQVRALSRLSFGSRGDPVMAQAATAQFEDVIALAGVWMADAPPQVSQEEASAALRHVNTAMTRVTDVVLPLYPPSKVNTLVDAAISVYRAVVPRLPEEELVNVLTGLTHLATVFGLRTGSAAVDAAPEDEVSQADGDSEGADAPEGVVLGDATVPKLAYGFAPTRNIVLFPRVLS
jgi:hypothetical protein